MLLALLVNNSGSCVCSTAGNAIFVTFCHSVDAAELANGRRLGTYFFRSLVTENAKTPLRLVAMIVGFDGNAHRLRLSTDTRSLFSVRFPASYIQPGKTRDQQQIHISKYLFEPCRADSIKPLSFPCLYVSEKALPSIRASFDFMERVKRLYLDATSSNNFFRSDLSILGINAELRWRAFLLHGWKTNVTVCRTRQGRLFWAVFLPDARKRVLVARVPMSPPVPFTSLPEILHELGFLGVASGGQESADKKVINVLAKTASSRSRQEFGANEPLGGGAMGRADRSFPSLASMNSLASLGNESLANESLFNRVSSATSLRSSASLRGGFKRKLGSRLGVRGILSRSRSRAGGMRAKDRAFLIQQLASGEVDTEEHRTLLRNLWELEQWNVITPANVKLWINDGILDALVVCICGFGHSTDVLGDLNIAVACLVRLMGNERSIVPDTRANRTPGPVQKISEELWGYDENASNLFMEASKGVVLSPSSVAMFVRIVMNHLKKCPLCVALLYVLLRLVKRVGGFAELFVAVAGPNLLLEYFDTLPAVGQLEALLPSGATLASARTAHDASPLLAGGAGFGGGAGGGGRPSSGGRPPVADRASPSGEAALKEQPANKSARRKDSASSKYAPSGLEGGIALTEPSGASKPFATAKSRRNLGLNLSIDVGGSGGVENAINTSKVKSKRDEFFFKVPDGKLRMGPSSPQNHGAGKKDDWIAGTRKPVVPSLNLKMFPDIPRTRSSRRLYSSGRESRTHHDSTKRGAQEELKEVATRLGESYMTADLSALVAIRRMGNPFIVEPYDFGRRKKPLSKEEDAYLNARIDTVNKCRVLVLMMVSMVAQKRTWRQRMRNPLNHLVPALFRAFSVVSTPPSLLRHSLIDVVTPYGADTEFLFSESRWRAATKGLSPELLEGLRLKADKIVWRANIRLHAVLHQHPDAAAVNHMSECLGVLHRYHQQMGSPVLAQHYMLAVMPLLLRVKFLLQSKGHAWVWRGEGLLLAHRLLMLMDSICDMSLNSAMDTFFFDMFVCDGRTVEWYREYARRILITARFSFDPPQVKKTAGFTSTSSSGDFLSSQNQSAAPAAEQSFETVLSRADSTLTFGSLATQASEVLDPGILRMPPEATEDLRTAVVGHFHTIVRLLQRREEQSNAHPFCRSINQSVHRAHHAARDLAGLEGHVTPAPLDDEDDDQSVSSAPYGEGQCTCAYCRVLSENQSALRRLSFAVAPELGYFPEFLSAGQATKQLKAKAAVLETLRDLFELRSCPFLSLRSYVDHYVSLHFISFIKLYNSHSESAATLDLCRLHLEALLSLCISRAPLVRRRFYQLRVMDLLVKEIDLEQDLAGQVSLYELLSFNQVNAQQQNAATKEQHKRFDLSRARTQLQMTRPKMSAGASMAQFKLQLQRTPFATVGEEEELKTSDSSAAAAAAGGADGGAESAGVFAPKKPLLMPSLKGVGGAGSVAGAAGGARRKRQRVRRTDSQTEGRGIRANLQLKLNTLSENAKSKDGESSSFAGVIGGRSLEDSDDEDDSGLIVSDNESRGSNSPRSVPVDDSLALSETADASRIIPETDETHDDPRASHLGDERLASVSEGSGDVDVSQTEYISETESTGSPLQTAGTESVSPDHTGEESRLTTGETTTGHAHTGSDQETSQGDLELDEVDDEEEEIKGEATLSGTESLLSSDTGQLTDGSVSESELTADDATLIGRKKTGLVPSIPKLSLAPQMTKGFSDATKADDSEQNYVKHVMQQEKSFKNGGFSAFEKAINKDAPKFQLLLDDPKKLRALGKSDPATEAAGDRKASKGSRNSAESGGTSSSKNVGPRRALSQMAVTSSLGAITEGAGTETSDVSDQETQAGLAEVRGGSSMTLRIPSLVLGGSEGKIREAGRSAASVAGSMSRASLLTNTPLSVTASIDSPLAGSSAGASPATPGSGKLISDAPKMPTSQVGFRGIPKEIFRTFAYTDLRRARKLYVDDNLHLTVIRLIICILLKDGQVLDSNYSDQNPGVSDKTNVLFILSQHLNHAANQHLIPTLLKYVSKIGPGALRLLKLTCQGLFWPELYPQNRMEKLGAGAFGTAYRCPVSLLCAAADGSAPGVISALGNNSGPISKIRDKGDLSMIVEQDYAVKLMDLPRSIHDRCIMHDIFTEIAILELFRHDPRICEIVDYGVTGGSYYVVMKKYRCSLKEWRLKQKLPLSRRLDVYLKIFSLILDAMKFLNHSNVNHYDLKCDNIFLAPVSASTTEDDFFYGKGPNLPFTVALGDFGESKLYSTGEDGYTTRNRGTEYIKSPEMLEVANAMKRTRETYDRRRKIGAGPKSDVWSLGCLFFELLTGEFLFYDDDWIRFFIRVTSKQEVLLTPERKSLVDSDPDLCQFLEYILIRDPAKRPGVDDVIIRFDTVQQQLSNKADKSDSSNICASPSQQQAGGFRSLADAGPSGLLGSPFSGPQGGFEAHMASLLHTPLAFALRALPLSRTASDRELLVPAAHRLLDLAAAHSERQNSAGSASAAAAAGRKDAQPAPAKHALFRDVYGKQCLGDLVAIDATVLVGGVEALQDARELRKAGISRLISGCNRRHTLDKSPDGVLSMAVNMSNESRSSAGSAKPPLSRDTRSLMSQNRPSSELHGFKQLALANDVLDALTDPSGSALLSFVARPPSENPLTPVAAASSSSGSGGSGDKNESKQAPSLGGKQLSSPTIHRSVSDQRILNGSTSPNGNHSQDTDDAGRISTLLKSLDDFLTDERLRRKIGLGLDAALDWIREATVQRGKVVIYDDQDLRVAGAVAMLHMVDQHAYSASRAFHYVSERLPRARLSLAMLRLLLAWEEDRTRAGFSVSHNCVPLAGHVMAGHALPTSPMHIFRHMPPEVPPSVRCLCGRVCFSFKAGHLGGLSRSMMTFSSRRSSRAGWCPQQAAGILLDDLARRFDVHLSKLLWFLADVRQTHSNCGRAAEAFSPRGYRPQQRRKDWVLHRCRVCRMVTHAQAAGGAVVSARDLGGFDQPLKVPEHSSGSPFTEADGSTISSSSDTNRSLGTSIGDYENEFAESPDPAARGLALDARFAVAVLINVPQAPLMP